MFVYRFFTSVFCILYLYNVAVSQEEGLEKISGLVTDMSGTGIPGISLRIAGRGLGAATDGLGRFEIVDVSSGSHQVLVTGIGYLEQKIDVEVRVGQRTEIMVMLEEYAEELQEVIVEGISLKKELESTGFAVHVIETRNAAFRSVQTNELLDRSVGVRVRQNGGLGSSVNYDLNGLSGNSVRIFIDGIPISTYGASFSLNSIPPSLIDRIEIYKGVIPAHLADDALGGAINIILKDGIHSNISASVSYGSFNTFQSNFNGLYRSPETGFTVKASGFYNHSDNNYEVWGKFVRNILPNGRYEYVRARRFNDAYSSAGGQLEMGLTDVAWADQLLLGINLSSDYNEIQHGNYMTIPYKGRYTTSNARVLSLQYKKNNFIVRGMDFTFSGMQSNREQMVSDTVRWNYNWYGQKSIGLHGDPILRPGGAQQGAPTINHIQRNVWTYRVGLQYAIGRHQRVAFNHMFNDTDRAEKDDMRSEAERSFIGKRYLRKNVSALSYETNLLQSKLKTNLFGKYYQQRMDKVDPVLVHENGIQQRKEERISDSRNSVGYGMAISYAIGSRMTLITSSEKAVRMPSENEIFGSPGDNITENPGLRPEISNNLNLGFRAVPYKTASHKTDVYVSGFVRDTRDKIVQRINPRSNDAVQTDPFENLGKTKSIGFEAELTHAYKENLSISLNLSRFNSVFNLRHDPNGNQYPYFGRQLPNEPFFTINSMVQYTFKGLLQAQSAFQIFYGFGYVDRFYITWLETEDFRTPHQFIQDLGVSYTFPDKRFVLSVDARNIFDRQAYDNFAVQKPGRAFYMKLNYTINNF